MRGGSLISERRQFCDYGEVQWQSETLCNCAISQNFVSRSAETLVALITFIDDNIIQLLLSKGIYLLKLQAGDLHLYSNFGLGRKAVRTGACSEPCSKGDSSKVAYAGTIFIHFPPWRCHSTKWSPVNLKQTYTTLHFKLSCVCTSVAT